MIFPGIYRKIAQAVNSLTRMAMLGVWLTGWTSHFVSATLLPDSIHAVYTQPILDKPDLIASPDEDISEAKQSLLLPDLRTLPPFDLRIVHMSDGMRQLRLSNTIWNSGQGSLELSGEISPSTNQIRVYQHITVSDDNLLKYLVGEFVWHLSHEHWHFEDFTLYELWSLKPDGALDSVLASSDKLSYCVMDTDPVDRDNPAFLPHRNYFDCGHSLQGLSAGWGDTYKSQLDGQSLDITAIPDGYYALISIVNPGTILLEADYKNNHAVVFLEIRNSRLKVIPLDEIRQENCRGYCWS